MTTTNWIEYYIIRNNINYNTDNLSFFTSDVMQSVSFIACSTVLYRTLLIYSQWKKTQKALQKVIIHNEKHVDITETIDVKETMKQMENNRNDLLYTKLSNCFIVYIIFGAIFIILRGFVYDKLNVIVWTSQVILAIIIIFTLKYNKVTDGIGVLTESWFVLALVVFVFIIKKLSNFNIYILYISTYVSTLSLIAWGMEIPIILTLYNIYKCEGTLNKNVWKNNYKAEIFNTVTKLENNISNSKKINEVDLDLPFFTFLENYKNYKAFAKYLSWCFALENLEFVQNVSIFYHIILEIQQNQSVASSSRKISEPVLNANETVSAQIPMQKLDMLQCASRSVNIYAEELQKVRRMKFKYLHKIYEEFNAIINDGNDMDGINDAKDFKYYQQRLRTIGKAICDEFIYDNSPKQINISYENRLQLIYTFESVKQTETCKSFEECMSVFDDALVEVYGLCISLYKYKFKRYIVDNKYYK